MIKTYKRNLKEFENLRVRAMQFVGGQTTKAQLIAFLNHVEDIDWREDEGGVVGLTIHTHEAFQPAEVEDGDFIFRGIDGEWCSCEEEEFNELFVEV